MSGATVAADPAVRDFVGRFGDAWARPTAEGLAGLCHPEVRLVQPMMPAMRGRPEAARGFAELLARVPDLRGEVVRWSGAGELVFIELTLTGTLARRPFSWTVADRILLEDGLVRERISYFDPVPLLFESLKAPRTWPGFVRLLRG